METFYTNEDGKLKIVTNLTQEQIIKKDDLIRERNDFVQRLMSTESEYTKTKQFFTEKIAEINEKISKCTELGIKTQEELIEEQLSE